MFLEKQAIEYFRRYDFLLPVFSGNTGDIPSRIIGSNREFEQYHDYQPGDDIRDIDWKIYGRTDRLFIKKYGSDLSSRVRIYLDISQSMSYEDKFDRARKTIAILFYLMQRFHTRVSLYTVNEELKKIGSLNLKNLEDSLSGLSTSGCLVPGNIPYDPRSVSILISDLWADMEDLAVLTGSRTHILHLLHPTEINLSFSGNVEFEDLETRQKLEVIPSTIREEYLGKMQERLSIQAGRHRQSGLIYGLLDGRERYYIQLKGILSAHSVQRQRITV